MATGNLRFYSISQMGLVHISYVIPREKERVEEMFEDLMVTNFQKLTKTHKCIDNKKHKEMFFKNNLRQATYKGTNRIKVLPTVTVKTRR